MLDEILNLQTSMCCQVRQLSLARLWDAESREVAVGRSHCTGVSVFKPNIAIGYLLFREVIWCQGESLNLTARI